MNFQRKLNIVLKRVLNGRRMTIAGCELEVENPFLVLFSTLVGCNGTIPLQPPSVLNIGVSMVLQ